MSTHGLLDVAGISELAAHLPVADGGVLQLHQAPRRGDVWDAARLFLPVCPASASPTSAKQQTLDSKQ